MTKKNERRIQDRDVREVVRIMEEVGSMAVAVDKVIAAKTISDFQAAERMRLYEKSYRQIHKRTTTTETEPTLSLFPDVRFQLPEYLHVEEATTSDENGKSKRTKNFLEKGRARLDQVVPSLRWRTIETQKIARGAIADENHWKSNDLPKLMAAGVPEDVTVNEARWWGIKCYLCGEGYDPARPLNIIVGEHLDPVSNGGGDDPRLPAHKGCNEAKAARLGYEQPLPLDDEDDDEGV